MEEELELLELLEREHPINWSVDFWKLTDKMHQEIRELVKKRRSGFGGGNGIETREGFREDVIKEIRYYDEHKTKMDGTVPNKWAFERIQKGGAR